MVNSFRSRQYIIFRILIFLILVGKTAYGKTLNENDICSPIEINGKPSPEKSLALIDSLQNALGSITIEKNKLLHNIFQNIKLSTSLRMHERELHNYNIICETLTQNILRETLVFWEQYPNDPRKFTLLPLPSAWGNFWANIPQSALKITQAEADAAEQQKSSYQVSYDGDFNWALYNKWQTLINENKAVIDSIYNLGKRSQDLKNNFFQVNRLEHFVWLTRNTAFRKNGKMNMDMLQQLILESADYAKIENIKFSNFSSYYTQYFSNALGLLKAFNNHILFAYKKLGLDIHDLFRLFSKFDKMQYPGLIKPIHQWENTLSLQFKRFKFSGVSLDGDTINLSNYIGKYVLIDIWSLGCTSCIARMPYLKALHEKYRAYGFEIISICAHNNTPKGQSEIRTIEKKINGSWPVILIGDVNTKNTDANRLWDEFGFLGVPQIFLLDRDGFTIAYNDNENLVSGDFEGYLKGLLHK